MSRTERRPSPSEHYEAGPRTDVSDDADVSSELVRMAEAAGREDYGELEARAQQFLSDVRRHNLEQNRGGGE